MIHIRKNEDFYLELVDGNVIAYSHITTDCSPIDDEFLHNLAKDYFNNENNEVGIQIGFNLSTLLDYTIYGHTIIDEKFLDDNSKPVFDKTKQELLKLIAKIDSLKYYEDLT